MHSRAVQSNSESRNGRHAATRCRRRMLAIGLHFADAIAAPRRSL
jgi:hypothetical protein